MKSKIKSRKNSFRVKKSTSETVIPINLTLSPDFLYPNNTFSQFYTILPEEIHLSGENYKVALTEFHYTVNYLVYLGSMILEAPSNEEGIEEIDQLIERIYENQESLQNKIVDLLTKTGDELTNAIFQVEEVASLLETLLNSYITLLNASSPTDPRLRFNEMKIAFNNFYNQLLVNTEILPLTHEIYKNFVKKLTNSLGIFKKQLDDFSTTTTKPHQIKIDIKINDRINKREFFNIMYNQLKRVCKKQEDYLVFKDNVKIIEIDESLQNFISIKNKTIFFEKLYPINYIKNFFIYTDIISQSFSQTPILRLVAAKGKKDDYINNIYDRPHFEPINKTRISKIFIRITDANDNLVEFTSGPLILKLEIRK